MQHFTSRETAASPRASRGWVIGGLWFLVCLTCCIDTRQFVYLSLSQTLVSESFILLLGLVAVFHSWRSKEPLVQHGVQYVALLWGLYLGVHSMLAQQTEFYKLTYLEVTLTLLFSLPYLLREGLLSRTTIERGWFLMLAVQLLVLLLQARGTVSSYNGFFTLTGCNENPNVTAILLAMVIPWLVDNVRKKRCRVGYVLLLILTVLFVVLLKCRTAYVGLLVMASIYVLSLDKVQAWWRQRPALHRVGIVVGVVAVLLSLSAGLYLMKQTSADGRLLVWKVSSRMMAENPWGIGTGMFERDYNLQQGEYFASGNAANAERWVSDTVYMAYNDYLEQGVETGWIGMLLLATLHVGFLWTAFRGRNRKALMLTAACAVMSGINFFYATIQPWIVLLSAVSMSANEKEDENENKILKSREHQNENPIRWMCKVLISMGIVVLLCVQLPLLWSQFRLGQLTHKAERGEYIDMKEAESLSKSISTSEAYWIFLYRQYRQHNDYENALRCIKQAQCYTSEPGVFFYAFNCLEKLGRTEEGILQVETVREMLPMNLTAKSVLLQWYECQEDTLAIHCMAQEILNTPVKVKNAKSEAIRMKAKGRVRCNE